MTVIEIRKYAREKGLDPGRMRKSELIRAIQSAENNPACFDSERKYNCPETNCLWEKDC